MERPVAELGDAVMSPLFGRVPQRCPVLHLYGTVSIPCAAVSQPRPAIGAPTQHGEMGRSSRNNIASSHEADLSPLPASRRSGKAVMMPTTSATHGSATPTSMPMRRCTRSSTCADLLRGSSSRHVCLHIHGVFPTFLVPQVDATVGPAEFGAQLEAVALRRLASSSAATGNDAGGRDDRIAGTSRAAVGELLHDVVLVQRRPIYGFHAHLHTFYEVSVVDPGMVEHLLSVLRESTDVGGRRWTIYNAPGRLHSQFMVNYNINGISPFLLPRCHVRLPTVEELQPNNLMHNIVLGAAAIIAHHDADVLERMTVCEVELDVAAGDLRAARIAAGCSPGEHLAHTRRGLKSYFKDHGVEDALRTANTIDMEEYHQAELRQRGTATMKDVEELRYGSVEQIQRNDPSVRAMRAEMLNIMERWSSRSTTTAATKREAHAPTSMELIHVRNRSSASYLGKSISSLDMAAPPIKHENVGMKGEGCTTEAGGDDDDGEDVIMTYELLDQLGARRSSQYVAQQLSFGSDGGDVLGCRAPSYSPSSHTQSSLAVPNAHEDVPSWSVDDCVGFGLWDAQHQWKLVVAARIVKLSHDVVHLQRFVHLHETHLRDDARRLARRGAWMLPSSPLEGEEDNAWRAIPCGELCLSSTCTSYSRAVLQNPATAAMELLASEVLLMIRPLLVVLNASLYCDAAHIDRPGTCTTEENEDEVVRTSSSRRTRLVSSSPLDIISTMQIPIVLCRYVYVDSCQHLLPLTTMTQRKLRRSARRVRAVMRSSHCTSADVAPPKQILLSTSLPLTSREEVVQSVSTPFSSQRALFLKQPELLWADDVPSSHSSSSALDEVDDEDAQLPTASVQMVKRNVSKSEEECVLHETSAVAHTPKEEAMAVDELATQVLSGPSVCSINSNLSMAQQLRMMSSMEDVELVGSSLTSVEVLSPPQQAAQVQAQHPIDAVSCCIVESELGMHVDGLPTPHLIMRDTGTGTPRMQIDASTWPVASCRSVRSTTKMKHNDGDDDDEEEEEDEPLPLLRRLQDRSVTAPVRRDGPPTSKPTTSAPATGVAATQEGIFRAQLHVRVLLLEVMSDRRAGVAEVAADTIVAVALGQAESHRDSIGVCLYAVDASRKRRGAPSINDVEVLSSSIEVVWLRSERELLHRVCLAIRHYDPDLLLSWEGYKFGLGLLTLRYRLVFDRSLCRDLSRCRPPQLPAPTRSWKGKKEGSMKKEVKMEEMDEEHGVSPPSSSSSSNNSAVTTEEDDEQLDSTDAAKSRVPPWRKQQQPTRTTTTSEDAPTRTPFAYARRFGANVRITGRVCSSIGKDLRKEIKLTSYTLQNLHQHLFGVPLPYFSLVALAALFRGDANPDEVVATRTVALRYLATQVMCTHRVARTVHYYSKALEFSRMYGILVEEVLTRGSQFRVEASLHRMALPQGYALLAPSRTMVMQQPRIHCVPLIMQPRNDFYREDPIVVLDFRSLYPSIIMAYNLCYSTCLGVVQAKPRGRLGVLPHFQYDLHALHKWVADEGEIGEALGSIISPNGVLFVQPHVREGVLAQLLRHILNTRFQVQAALQHVAEPHDDVVMQRSLDDQQLALKMLANVSYGYTAASFSGRMPCVHLAEAVVSLGRQTLERAVELIRRNSTWGAEVVYGDTDSIFLRLRGRNKAEAFDVGNAIAAAITAANPSPIRLQMEKVLLPCMLLVKKRYVGYAWFSPDQRTPKWLAKGIETVRRDQCGLTAQLTEMLIRKLFDGAPVAALRSAYHAAVLRLQRGACSPMDCIFRRGVKLGRYTDDAHLPPAARLALRRMETDLSMTPYWGERMPYVVVHRIDSHQLRDQVVHPDVFAYADEAEVAINVGYYVERHINPTLNRILYLIGVSCTKWYAQMPRPRQWMEQMEEEGWRWRRAPRVVAAVMARRKRVREAGEEEEGHPTAPAHGCEEEPVVVMDATQRFPTQMVVEEVMDPTQRPPPRIATREQNRTLDAFCTRQRCVVCHHGLLFSRRRAPGDESTDIDDDAAPPVCEACWRSPQQTYLTIIMRCRRVALRLHEAEQACLLCIGSSGTVGGPGWIDARTKLPSIPDLEDVVPSRGGAVAVPRHLGRAVVSSRSASLLGTTVGCQSMDCELPFTKKRLVLLLRQLQALQESLGHCLMPPSLKK